ncbi:MAG TPA: hypothetical protein VE961_10090 [Pyrinomonadaceae bacterium]|nr:hypothetical protein [Pyrinomonadaceae bacterium]
MPEDPDPVNPVETSPLPCDTRPTAAEMAVYRYLSGEFEMQIKAQKTNVVISSAFACGVWVAGLIGTALLYRSTGLSGTALEYMKLGPAALSSLALPFPLRSFLQYRLRIPIYRGYKRLLDEAIAADTRVESYLIEDARDALKALQKVD